MGSRKTWKEKLTQAKNLPKVEPITESMSQRWGTGTVAIPHPLDVDAIMKKVPKGKLITINEIRQSIAKKYKASIGCPLTTGIFSWVAAHSAEEEAMEGKKRVTPYWRTLKSGGELNPKFPGGIKNLKILLEHEGHKIIKKGKRYFVENYEKALMKV